MSEWHNIFTAPDDGKEFLAWFGHQKVMALVRWHRVNRVWMSKGEVVHGFMANATHWTSLPSPPTPSKARQTEEAR